MWKKKAPTNVKEVFHQDQMLFDCLNCPPFSVCMDYLFIPPVWRVSAHDQQNSRKNGAGIWHWVLNMWYVRLCACLWAIEEMMSIAPLPPRGNKSRVWQNNASFPTYESRRALLRCINTLSDLAHETTWNWLLGLRNISPFEVPVICLISKMFFQWFVKEKRELYPTLGIAKRNKAWGQGNGGFLEVYVCDCSRAAVRVPFPSAVSVRWMVEGT